MCIYSPVGNFLRLIFLPCVGDGILISKSFTVKLLLLTSPTFLKRRNKTFVLRCYRPLSKILLLSLFYKF